MAGARPGRRDGCLLFGFGVTSYAPKLEVTIASTPGPRAQATENSFRADGAHDLELSRSIAAQSNGAIVEIGHWHVHPSGDARPSPADLNYWSGLRDALDQQRVTSRYVALIVASHLLDGWLRPEAHAWITQRTTTGRVTAQRAALTRGTA